MFWIALVNDMMAADPFGEEELLPVLLATGVDFEVLIILSECTSYNNAFIPFNNSVVKKLIWIY